MKKFIQGLFILTLLAGSAYAEQTAGVKVDYINKSFQSNPPTTQSLADYWVNAYAPQNLKVEKSTLTDSLCGDAYFIDLKVHSFLNSVQVEMDYYVQTLTQESQERLYSAIKANFASKGLPKCLLQDQFAIEGGELMVFTYSYNPDFTTVSVTVPTVPVPAGYSCSGKIERPLTSCWNVTNPYGE